MTERGTDVTKMKKTYRKPVEGDFPEDLIVQLRLESPLRYGDNPNQAAGLYRTVGIHNGVHPDDLKNYAIGNDDANVLKMLDNMYQAFYQHTVAEFTKIRNVKSGKGGLSATNVRDISHAMEILKYFTNPSVAVMKHLVPSGFATLNKDETLDQLYIKARDADARSAFGGVVVSNVPIDKATAEAIMSSYVEVVVAPGYENGAMEHFEKKKDIRVATFENLDKIPKFVGDEVEEHNFGLILDVISMPTGRVLVQQPYLSSIKSADDLITDPLVTKKDHDPVYVKRDPTEQEMRDLRAAWYANLGVRSNGIVIFKDGVTLAVGTGQQERVGALEQAIVKAYQKAMDRAGIKYDTLNGAQERDKLDSNPLEGAVVSSDAFFPFRDSIDTMARVGITAVIQPGGSVRDYEVIQAVNEHNTAMVYTLERCFGHF